MSLQDLAEAMARIEYKLDLLLEGQAGGQVRSYASLGSARRCPACGQPVRHQLGVFTKAVTRICGCKTGIVPPPDMAALAPPEAAGGRRGGESNESNDSDDSGSSGRRRRQNPDAGRSR